MRFGWWNSWLRLAETFAPYAPSIRRQRPCRAARLTLHCRYRIVQFDASAEQPVLDARGRVKLCDDDEVGEILGCINAKRPNQAFTGYTSADATMKKIINGAFRDGDQFFRSGDLMRMDSSGFVYFVDRIGDTFRWKGENVSTNEVADALSRCTCVEEANVYGVQLPNADGRIGMAAIVFGDGGADWRQLAQHVKQELPSYAIPYFVRPLGAQEITGTFKHRKVELVKDGWTAGGDAVFFYGKQCRARARRCEITYGTQTLSPVTTFPSTTTSSAA
jgi:acyl-CoA synthetase (AMP-forming)/AMP-acid ligase II